MWVDTQKQKPKIDKDEYKEAFSHFKKLKNKYINKSHRIMCYL